MTGYNLTKSEDRARLRADRQGELDAIANKTWPRNLNERMRWTAPTYKVQGRYWTDVEWAKHMCEFELQYLDGVDVRLAVGDPDLKGWEGWVDPTA